MTQRCIIAAAAVVAALAAPASAQHTAADRDQLMQCGAAFAVSAQQAQSDGNAAGAEVSQLFGERMFANAEAIHAAEGRSAAEIAALRQREMDAMSKLMASGGEPSFSSETCMTKMIVDAPVMSADSEKHLLCGAWFTLRAEFDGRLGDAGGAGELQAMATPLLERSGMLLLADGFATDSLEQIGSSETAKLGQHLINGNPMPYTDAECRALAGQ